MPLTVLSVAYPLARASPGTAGGAEQVLLTIDRALIQQGHRSLVIAAAGSHCAGLLQPVQIPDGVLNESTRREAQWQFRKAVDQALTDFHIDLVHMHGLDFQQYMPSHEFPVLVTLHLPLGWYKPLAVYPGHHNIHFICVSRTQAMTAPAGFQIEAVISNGIEIREFSPVRRKGSYALIMSRICPEKGIHLALDAARLADVPVLLAGTVFDYPEHRAYFEKCIKPRLHHNVHFVGPVGGKHKASLLAGAKCVLISSQAQETSSLVAIEALASGTPVVAWRSGALPEIVAHGRTGWLVSSVEEMAAAIKRIADIDPFECRREAEQRFCSQHMIADYLSLYRRIVAGAQIKEFQVA